MTRSTRTRRTVLKTAGATLLVTTTAGCSGDDGDDDDDGGAEETEDEQNPTLILQEGEEYEIGWTEGDGTRHNIEIWDEDGDVVEDYETDLTDDPGDDQILSITAAEEMAAYRCRPHGSMEGEIRVE
ncbi:cupredoxin domain-containing protein [Natronococcus sp.]|uniref:cupredoxin domain-containing protein n=1 Tax=Natronococcus sp. TaxID=35747 RepID=UPI003A4E047C